MNYDHELAFAKELASQAGKMMIANLDSTSKTKWKQDNTPITETDININNFVIKKVQTTFLSDGILGEENSHEAGRDRLWVVDPIDGTLAFDLGAPLSTFCLSLVIDGLPVLGVIHDPYLNRMYWAIKGGGAYVNDEAIHVSEDAELHQKYVVLSSRMGEGLKKTGQLFDAIEATGAKSFNFRSFAYGSTYVASGKAVAAVIGVGNPWDAAATKIIVEEAGGMVTDVNGEERRYDQQGDGLVATNGLVHDEVLRLIRI